MTTSQINIDFKLLGPAFQKYVWEKALQANSTIVYYEGNLLMEENPGTGEKKFCKDITIFKYPHYMF